MKDASHLGFPFSLPFEGLPSGLLCQSIAPTCLDISFLFCFQQSRQFLGSHLDDDRHSLYSNASSVSSFSGKESSSKSSAKVSARKRVQGKLVIHPLALEILRKKKHICESDTQLGSVRVIYCQISTAEGHVQQVSSETSNLNFSHSHSTSVVRRSYQMSSQRLTSARVACFHCPIPIAEAPYPHPHHTPSSSQG